MFQPAWGALAQQQSAKLTVCSVAFTVTYSQPRKILINFAWCCRLQVADFQLLISTNGCLWLERS